MDRAEFLAFIKTTGLEARISRALKDEKNGSAT